MESFIAHNVSSPYRQSIIDAFHHRRVPMNIDLEMPTFETIKKAVRGKMGVCFLPRICVMEELAAGSRVEVRVRELKANRTILLVYPTKREPSHAAGAFLDVVKNARTATSQKADPHTSSETDLNAESPPKRSR